MTPREPDRYEARARELIVGRLYGISDKEINEIAAALRQAADESLGEVRQYVEAMPVCTRVGVLRLLDDLKSPAAAPAAETHTPECHSRRIDPVNGGRLYCNCKPPSEPVAPAPSCTCKWRLEQSIRHAPDCPVVASPAAQGKETRKP